ncbi:MAG: cytochrome c peroxidase [Bacteroidota bacterium]
MIMRSIIINGFYSILLILVVFIAASLSFADDTRKEKIQVAFHAYLEKHATEMLSVLHEFKNEVSSGSKMDSTGIPLLKNKFLELRSAYKKFEPFSCYYFIASERNFNGPVVSEIEDESEEHPKLELPHGLQVMESYLWDDQPALFSKQLVYEIELMDENLSALNIAFRTVPTDEARFIEALQLQVIRTFTLGISGFDTPESKSLIPETKVSILSMIEILKDAYKDDLTQPTVVSLMKQLNRSLAYFNSISSIEKIDFLSCYRDYYMPLSKALYQMRNQFVENNYFPPSALNFSSPSLFETDAFNRFFYNPRGTDPSFSADAAALGKALFYDPLLSENNKRACASCHQPERAFTDGMKTSNGFLEGEMLTRNAPTLINAALQRNYFYDMRADHLEGQIGHVLNNKKEMQSSFESAVAKLNSSPEYVFWFRRAFKGREDTLISKTSIENAISEYERTLVSLNSKFDRNIRGEEKSFSTEEKSGFNVFMNKGRCATCHYMPLFNNVVPPYFTRSEFEIIGTTKTHDLVHPEIDPDKGRGGLYGTEIFMRAFKTPTLRNISLTAPYMHNGNFENLEQVIEFYNKGGGAGLGIEVKNQTLSPDSLQLTAKEKKSLIAFLNTLTDTVHMTAKPVHLPELTDLSLDKRKIGGEY